MAAPSPRLAPVTRATAPSTFMSVASEEREGALDELLVELEDAAVAGVGVDHQVRVRQPLGQIDRVARGDHPVGLAVGHEDRLVDDREVGGRLLAPAVDGLELGAVGPQRDGLSRCWVRSLRRARNSLPARRPAGVRVKKRNCFGSCKVSSPRSVSKCESRVTLRDPVTAGGTGAGEDDLADELRFVRGDQLGDHAAHREAEEVDLLETQRADEGDRVLRHRLDRVGRGTARRADPPVVEGDDPVLRGDAVDDSGIPVVQDGGQVGEEDHRDTGRRAELAVGEVDTADRDRAGRRGCLRRHHVAVVFLIGPRSSWLSSCAPRYWIMIVL